MNDMFLFYRTWFEQIEEYYGDNIPLRNALIAAIVTYGITGEETYPEESRTSGSHMTLDLIYSNLDIQEAKHRERVESGRKGGKNGKGEAKARFGNKNASKRKLTQPYNIKDYNITSSGMAINSQPSDDEYWQ